MKRKRYDKGTYIGFFGLIVLVFALGVIVVKRMTTDMISDFEGRRSPIQEQFMETTSVAVAAPVREPTTEVEPEETATPARSGRYAEIKLEARDCETLARLVWHEARGEPFEGQVAVVEVVLNRILSTSFPDTIEEVVYQTEPVVQFSPAKYIPTTTPTETQYRAVEEALTAERQITEADVVYFSTEAQNDRVFAEIGNHIFCRE